ncbi:MAG: hypothetical protein NTW52_17575 [Planctomycetota bacterium]|nr:hypothetical protein [Planctomycetota bacterium]
MFAYHVRTLALADERKAIGSESLTQLEGSREGTTWDASDKSHQSIAQEAET